MNNNGLTKNRKLIAAIAVVLLVLILVTVGLSIFRADNGPVTKVAEQDTTQEPIANFTGDKSKEFFNSISDNNYNAARVLVGDFLVNSEKVTYKGKATMVPACEILSFSTDYGANTTFLVNFECKSVNNNKTYSVQIVNYMDNSKSSYLKIIDHDYERTFGQSL